MLKLSIALFTIGNCLTSLLTSPPTTQVHTYSVNVVFGIDSIRTLGTPSIFRYGKTMQYKLVADTKQVQFAVQPGAIPGKLTKKKNQTEDKATLSTAAEILIDPGPNAC